MSDEPRPPAEPHRELARTLHELAEDHETPLPVPGAEIRRRAVRRRRRRHASLATVGAGAVAAVSLVLSMAFVGGKDGGGKDGHSRPPAPPAATLKAPGPSSVAGSVPAATVNLSRRELVVGGRVLPISAGAAKTPTPTGRMTVTGKYKVAVLPADTLGFGRGYETKTPWVIQLRTPQNRTNYIVAFTLDEKAPGNYDSTAGWIGLRRGDAEWLYRRIEPGAVVAVVGAAPTPTTDAPPAPARTMPSGTAS
ncbi:L,D-transpeptidase [Streptomyces yerevanensis]|uniref:L,D-transpeptidase n=1 Tax=Streptomyces yerevanensis TaxID=66378 RepID=UPI0005249E67|nr:L,D-transpeptidase [Streptomyces yerevanensis]